MAQFNMPINCKPVEAITPQAGGAITGDWLSTKLVEMVYIVVHINQANAAPVAITINQATNVAAGSTTPITAVVPIWANEDCATSDLLVEQTAAVGFTTSAATTHKVIVFKVDPAGLAEGFDCLTVITAVSDVANITSAMYYVVPRYTNRVLTALTAVTD